MSGRTEWWSWSRLMKEIPSLGIPHFQRGQVWGTGNRVALLESMYEASPCGSFVLWQPDGDHEWDRIGISLVNGKDVGPHTKWLVDGQQRTRALLSVYCEMQAAERDADSPRLLGEDVFGEIQSWMPELEPAPDAEDGRDASDDHVSRKATWYAVLPALESLQQIFGTWAESRQVLRGSLFRMYHPIERKAQRVPLPRGLVPLSVLLAKESGPFAVGKTRDEVLGALEAGKRDHGTLDRLVPWGPQFLTGFACDGSGEERRQISWSSIPDVDAAKLVALLKAESEELQKFSTMLDGPRFAAGELPRKNLSMAITAYVRINRAGVRVQPEEQALALLTRWDDAILNYLGDFCRCRDHANEKVADQRTFLSHASEKQMGFQLWMSTVTRYTALFVMAKYARSWMGVSAMDKQTFTDELERWPEKERTYGRPKTLIKAAAEQASGALLLIDDILSKELSLDHRMARRDAHSMLPVLELLSHLSTKDLVAVKKHGQIRSALAHLLHITMLHAYLDNAEMLGLCDAIHGPQGNDVDGKWNVWNLSPAGGEPDPASEFGMAMRRYLKELHSLWMHERLGTRGEVSGPERVVPAGKRLLDDLQAWGLEQFGKDVDSATSLQSSAVGWLYAIQRRAVARELNWRVQVEAYRADKSVGIHSMDARAFEATQLGAHRDQPDLHPERQHIVPFSLAKKIAGKGGTRTTASVANAIGNLTWLSARQNGFQCGFSNRWAVFDEKVEADNLRAHGMLFETDSKSGAGRVRAIDLYLKLQKLVGQAKSLSRDAWPTAFNALYEDFRNARTSWMKQQMKAWLDEPISDKAMDWLVGR